MDPDRTHACLVLPRLCMPTIPGNAVYPVISRRPLYANAFQDIGTTTPFLNRRSFKILLFVLLIVSLIMFAVNVVIALVMIFAVLLSYGGSFIKIVKATSKAGFSVGYLVFGIQGSALLIYVISFLTAISRSGTS